MILAAASGLDGCASGRVSDSSSLRLAEHTAPSRCWSLATTRRQKFFGPRGISPPETVETPRIAHSTDAHGTYAWAARAKSWLRGLYATAPEGRSFSSLSMAGAPSSIWWPSLRRVAVPPDTPSGGSGHGGG